MGRDLQASFNNRKSEDTRNEGESRPLKQRTILRQNRRDQVGKTNDTNDELIDLIPKRKRRRIERDQILEDEVEER